MILGYAKRKNQIWQKVIAEKDLKYNTVSGPASYKQYLIIDELEGETNWVNKSFFTEFIFIKNIEKLEII